MAADILRVKENKITKPIIIAHIAVKEDLHDVLFIQIVFCFVSPAT